MINNTQIKEKILSSIQTAQQKGFTLITDEWGDDKMKCACALGCVAVAEGINITDEPTDISALLGVSDNWVNSFIDGFDNNGYAEGASDPKAWKVGQEVRSQTSPIDYLKFVYSMEIDHE